MKLFQIYEDDLATLERECPLLMDMLMPNMTNAARVKCRTIKDVLSRVRWNYGPPKDIHVVDTETHP